MSTRTHKYAIPQGQAAVFSALGDTHRLALLRKLCRGEPLSISQLATGSRLTRQGVTKHLRVLESAGLARSIRRGRECLFKFQPVPIEEARRYLDLVSAQWDEALDRLKSFVEE